MASDLGFSFTWWGHSCIEVTTPEGRTILFDPWFGNPRSPKAVDSVDACDVLLVTHGHHDHLGSAPRGVAEADALTIARRTQPTWPCVHEMSLWLEEQPGEALGEVIGMNKGGTVDARGLKVTMVHADHSAGDWSVPGAGPLYLGEPAGFVVEFQDGRRIYHSGDTNVFRDMDLIRELYRPEVAFLPIGGHYTMGPGEAAMAVELLGVRAVVPIHYGTFPVLAGTPDALRKALDHRGLTKIEIIESEPGERQD
jgi:L-ascorbate metabolism protein UlaG (beta-lactamase superfamily)